MNFRTLLWVLLPALCLFAGAASAAPRAIGLYVAADGNDAWSGRLKAPNRRRTDGPFATLKRARDAVRQARRAAHAGLRATVTIRGGVYRVTDTLVLDAEDSGAPGAETIWRAMPSETIRLVGGARLNDFHPVTDRAVLDRLAPEARANVLQIDLRTVGVSDFGRPVPVGGAAAQLVCDRRYMTLARYPGTGEWLKIAGIPTGGTKYVTESDSHYGRFTYDSERPASWKKTSDLWVHGYWVWDWSDQYQRVAKLDLKKREIWPEPPYHIYGYRKGQRFYFLNVLEELNAPGEWYLDRNAGILYFWPPRDAAKAEIYFPELTRPMFRLKGARWIRIRELTMECSRGEAIVVEGGDHNEIVGCVVRCIGAETAVAISGSDNGIRSSDIYEVAGTGVRLDGGDRKTLTPAHNYAINDEIHDVAQVYRTYHGALNISGVGQIISHCAIHDMPHEGIGYDGNDHVIEWCDFTRIAQETGDVGVTYTSADWTYMGQEFRYNYFHEIHGPGHIGCFTIYPDLPCGGIHLHHNIFYKVDQGFYTNSGRGMLIENNIFVKCGRSLGFGTWPDAAMFKEGGAWKMVEKLREVSYDRPPYSERYPALKQLAADFALGDQHILERERPKDNVIRGNVSWGASFLDMWPQAGLQHVRVEQNVIADDVVFSGAIDGGKKTTTYRNGDERIAAELGKRGNIIVRGNPGLRLPDAGDFGVVPRSAARKIGFQPIPLGRIGLQRDSYRRSIELRQR